MKTTQDKYFNRMKRHRRSRARIAGTASRPRLGVYRSNNAVYGFLVDDQAGKTLVSASSLKAEKKKDQKPKDLAHAVGEELAQKAKSLKITKVVFDRSGYRYHGRVKALAEGSRSAGLEF